MPIEPLDPNAFRPAVFQSPVDIQARRMSLTNMGQQQTLQAQAIRENEMAYREKRDAEGRMLAVRQILAESPDWETALPKIKVADPYNYSKFQEAAIAQTKAKEEEQKAQYELGQKIKGDIGKGAAAVLSNKDPDKIVAAYKGWRAGLTVDPFYINHPTGKQVLASIPQDVTPDQIRQLARQYAPDIVSKMEADEIKAAVERDRAERERLRRPNVTASLETGLMPQQAAQSAAAMARLAETRQRNKDLAAAAMERNAIAREKKTEKDQTSRLDRIQREFDKFDGDEQKWHAERERLGDLLAAKDPVYNRLSPNEPGEEVMWRGRIVQMDPVLRAEIQRNFDKATKETERLADLKARKLAEMGKGETTAVPATQAAKPQTYTEADVRKRAKAKGLDENAAVAAARNAGLIR